MCLSRISLQRYLCVSCLSSCFLTGGEAGILRGTLFLRAPGPESSASRLFWSGHAGRQMVSRTVFALLRLNGLIVHMHIHLDCGHILMPQQFLEAKRIIAQHQITNGECMAEDMRANSFASDSGALF